MGKLSDFDHLRVEEGKKFKLRDHRSNSTRHIPKREEADEATTKAVEQLGKLQDALYAEGRQSLLVILQGMDAAGLITLDAHFDLRDGISNGSPVTRKTRTCTSAPR